MLLGAGKRYANTTNELTRSTSGEVTGLSSQRGWIRIPQESMRKA